MVGVFRERLFAVDQKKHDARRIKQAWTLHEKGQASRGSRKGEPTDSRIAEIAKDGQGTKGREKQTIPGRHGRCIVRNAQNNGQESNCSRRPGGYEVACDGVDSGNPGEEKQEKHVSQRHQFRAEESKGQGVKVSEPAGVRFVRVAMRDLACDYSLGRLAEDALVVGNPITIQLRQEVNGREQESDSTGKTTSGPERSAIGHSLVHRRK